VLQEADRRDRPLYPAVFRKQKFADHTARLSESLSESVRAHKTSTTRLDPLTWTVGSLMTCTNEAPIKRKTARAGYRGANGGHLSRT